jgi:tetratricopeptide (TPR) repeat protein
MRFSSILPLVFVVANICPCAAQNAGAKPETNRSALQRGVAALQKNDLANARSALAEALHNEPSNPAVLYNFGLVNLKDNQFGMALALWRKALHLDPQFRQARQGILFASHKLEHPEIAHDVELSETLHREVLVNVTRFQCTLLWLAVSLLLGLSVIRYIGARHRADASELPMPSFPWLAAVAFVLFCLSSALEVAKIIDAQETRATIVVKKIEARSAPRTDATVLFELYEGLEVVLQQQTEMPTRGNETAWAQVTYPGGNTGWVPRSSLFSVTDREQVKQ